MLPFRLSTPISWLALMALGCNTVLGIEPLSDAAPDSGVMMLPSTSEPGVRDAGNQPKPAGRAADSGAGDSADAATTEADSAAGSGEAGTTGRAAPDAAAAGHAGPENTAGAAASAGSQNAALEPVLGRVVDYRMQPVPGARVRIDGRDAITGGDGYFSIATDARVYDVTVNISTNVNNLATQIAWQVVGLTQRKPLLQVYRGFPTRSASIELKANGVTFPLTDTQRLVTTWASPSGEFSTTLSGSSVTTSASWTGPVVSEGIAHALLFDTAGAPALPTKYSAHHAVPITLRDSAPLTAIDFDLTAQTIGTNSISGSITGSNQNRGVQVYARFKDNSALELLSDDRGADGFSYTVPVLSDATFTVAAQDLVNGRDQGMAAAYVDRVVPGQTSIALALPGITNLVAPGDQKQEIDADTLFEWRGTAKVYLFCVVSSLNFDLACVLTSASSARIPVMPASDFTTAAATPYRWYVETHDAFADVDAATGPTGYLSAYALGEIRGPRRGAGSYSSSPVRSFTTAP